MNKKILFVLFSILILSCSSDDSLESEELSLSERLIGEWTLTNYHDDSYFVQDQYGIIEQMVGDETDYGIEFTDNPNKINTTGFLRYTRDEYEIVAGEKVITKSAGTNFWDGNNGEGLHTGEWSIENGMLINSDVSPQEGIEYSIISSIELSGNRLKLILDNAQFGSHLTGKIMIEYRRK